MNTIDQVKIRNRHFRSRKFPCFILIAAVSFLVFSGKSFGEAGASSSAGNAAASGNTARRLQKFEAELNDVKQSQINILKSQEEIVRTIKNLKIWVNKHR